MNRHTSPVFWHYVPDMKLLLLPTFREPTELNKMRCSKSRLLWNAGCRLSCISIKLHTFILQTLLGTHLVMTSFLQIWIQLLIYIPFALVSGLPFKYICLSFQIQCMGYIPSTDPYQDCKKVNQRFDLPSVCICDPWSFSILPQATVSSLLTQTQALPNKQNK